MHKDEFFRGDQTDHVLYCLQTQMNANCLIRRCVKVATVGTQREAMSVTAPADTTTTQSSWSAQVSKTEMCARESNGSDLSSN